MTRISRRAFLRGAGSLGLLPLVPRGAAQPASAPPLQGDAAETLLWFAQPASRWIDALPLGNGRLGAMVFGGVNAERLQLNDEIGRAHV